MYILSFRATGVCNSYKIPVFKNYHKSYLTPPKTVIIGMLCNIMNKGERYFYETLQHQINVSVVVEDLWWTMKDLWWYKTLSSGNQGKSVIRREKYVYPSYRIYLSFDDERIYDEVYQSLLSPQSIPSLGQDDEMVSLRDVQKIDLTKSSYPIIHSAFATDNDISFRIKDMDFSKYMIAPTVHYMYTKFTTPYDAKTDKNQKRNHRDVIEHKNIVEFYNTSVEIVKWSLQLWHDAKTNYTISFY